MIYYIKKEMCSSLDARTPALKTFLIQYLGFFWGVCDDSRFVQVQCLHIQGSNKHCRTKIGQAHSTQQYSAFASSCLIVSPKTATYAEQEGRTAYKMLRCGNAYEHY